MATELNVDFSIDQLAKLSRLSLTKEERQTLERDILSILDFTKILSSQDLSQYQDQYQSVDVDNIFREDEEYNYPLPIESLVKADNLSGRYIKVGRVIK